MKKFFIKNKEILNKEELATGKVSYRRLIEKLTDNSILLCNNIVNIDDSIWDNFNMLDEGIEIYQWYLCDFNIDLAKLADDYGIIATHSDLLDLDVLCVNHYGTSWDYVMSDVEWTENIEEC